MRTLFIFLSLMILHENLFSQCENTNQNPAEEVVLPLFSDYQMVVAHNIKAGDYFDLAYVGIENLTIDQSDNDPVYIHIYRKESNGDLTLMNDGPTPLTTTLVFGHHQVHINKISPPCGTDDINRTITIECETCPVHQGVGVNTTIVDKSAALHIASYKGGLILPIQDPNLVPYPSTGLMTYYFGELNYFDGSKWKESLSIDQNSSRFDFVQSNYNFDGTDGTFISIFNPTVGAGSPMSGIRFFRGDDEDDRAAAIYFRNNNLYFAIKDDYSDDTISIDHSFLEMDEDDFLYQGSRISFRESIDYTASVSIDGYENSGSASALKITSGSQTMRMDGNEIDSYSSSGLYLQNNSDDDIVLVNGGGLVGIAETSPNSMLHIKQQGAEYGLMIENNTDADDWAFDVGLNDMNVRFNGVLKALINDTNGAWVQASDRRLKKDITYDNRSVLPSLLRLKPASYRYKDNTDDSPLSYGFIAQEVQELFPELVNSDEGEYLTISYAEFSVLAIKAIQEQQEVITGLLTKYEALEERLARLEE